MEEEKEEEGKTKGKTTEDVKMKGKTALLLEEEEGKTKGKTASLLEEEPPDPHYRRPQEVAGEVEWTWKRESVQGQGLGLRVTLSYKKTVFEDIRSVLFKVGKKELEQQFVDGCFGHLINFVGGINCIKALYELLAREITLHHARGREDGLWFRIGGTNVRFSPSEFALVTGLHFGSSTFDPHGRYEMPKDGVCNRLFSGHAITIDDLLKKFNSQRVPGSPQDYLKMANVLALYLMVLGYSHSRRVEEWVWVLVEDLDSWNRFPWGAYSYQALKHYIGLLPKTKKGFDNINSFLGPMWALQIWAYEAIPELGDTCAWVTGQATMPRCLKWKFRNKKIALAPHFFEKKLECFVALYPTDEEKLQPYWMSVQTPQPLSVRYTAPRLHLRRGRRRAGAQLEFEESVSSQQEHSSDSDDSTQMPSPPQERTCSSWKKNDSPPQGFDEAYLVDRVSDRVVDRLIEPVLERLSQRLIPQMKQWIESRQSPSQPQPSSEVHDELEKMHDISFLHAKLPAESAKTAERILKEKQSCNGGSSSMNISRKTDNGHFPREKTKPVQKDAFGGEEQLEGVDNAPRLDTGVAGGAKSSANRKDAIDQDQIDSVECLKGELKGMSHTSPHHEGDEANIAKKKNKKDKKKKKESMSKQTRRSPSSSEDEGSESSSGNGRRRKLKKRSKKKKRKHSDSSSFESNQGRDKHRRKRNRHRRRHSSSSEASDSVSPSD